MPNTKQATPRFVVFEASDGPWIMIEQSGGDDLSLFEKTIGFKLHPGTTFEEAKAISNYLNSKLLVVTETS
jgi:hypothetical protein